MPFLLLGAGCTGHLGGRDTASCPCFVPTLLARERCRENTASAACTLSKMSGVRPLWAFAGDHADLKETRKQTARQGRRNKMSDVVELHGNCEATPCKRESVAITSQDDKATVRGKNYHKGCEPTSEQL